MGQGAKGAARTWGLTNAVGWLTLMSMVAGLYAVFIYAPTEKEMGIVQRIFYFHVPSAWVAYLAFFITFVSSIAYLKTHRRQWDTLAHCSVEVGILFASLVLITGPIWGKPVWGTWWTWDARLTSTLILWLIYAGYLMLRSYVADRDQRARYSAVLGIVGALDIPIIHFSVVWWRTLHPEPTVIRPEGPTLDPRMLLTLMICLAAFTLLYIYLMLHRVRLENLRERVAQLKLRISSEEGLLERDLSKPPAAPRVKGPPS